MDVVSNVLEALVKVISTNEIKLREQTKCAKCGRITRLYQKHQCRDCLARDFARLRAEYLALSAGLTLTVDCQHYVAQQIDVDPTRFCPLGRIAPEALEQAR